MRDVVIAGTPRFDKSLDRGVRSLAEEPTSEPAAHRAYELAGVEPEDFDVVELQDALAEIILYEEFGLCGSGESPDLLASGATQLGGQLPANTSSGLLSKGHPIGSGQLVEPVEQLRGQAGRRQIQRARMALAENGGGYLGTDAAAVHILAK